ncbi:proline-rich protein 19 [Polymixia lowei]
MKRMKTRKERSQVRGSEGGVSKRKSHHHHHQQQHHHQRSQDKAHFHSYCKSSCHCPPRRDALFARMFPSAQEPSIITDSRLTGHHGLFNHEVKSIDIERLLSEQRKLEKLRQPGPQEENMAALHSPCSSNDANTAITNDGVLIEKNADLVICNIKTQQVCQEKDHSACQSNSQGSDITPGQRPTHHLGCSSESDNAIFSPINSHSDVLTTKSKKAKPVLSETERESQLTSSGDKENVRPLSKKGKTKLNCHNAEHTLKNQGLPRHQTQPCGPSPKLLQLSSSPVAGSSDSFGAQQQGSGLDCLPKSITAVAARLCRSLQFPFLSRRRLVAESREVLLHALRERHGALLQENLLGVQRCLSFGAGPHQWQDKGPPPLDIGGVCPNDAFNTAFQVNRVDRSCFDTQKMASLKRRRKQHHSNFTSPLQPQQSLHQAVEWRTSPSVERVGDLLDELLRPSSSQFCVDLQPSGASSPHDLFALPPTTRWGCQPSPPEPSDNRFNGATTRESARLDCFENCSLSQTNLARERNSWPRYGESRRHPFLHYLPGHPGGHPAGAPQEQDPFEVDGFAPSCSVQYCQENNQLRPFYHFGHPPTSSLLRSHHADMTHYPPSRTLERSWSPPLPVFTSPEPWSFPPMRLY